MTSPLRGRVCRQSRQAGRARGGTGRRQCQRWRQRPSRTGSALGVVHLDATDRAWARGYGALVLDLSSLDLEDIATALADQTDYEHRWLINPETGEIVFWTSDTGIDGQTAVDLDELDLLCIEPLPSYIWYQDMADFAAQVSDERAGRRLARALQGKGAFRRFRAELHEEFPHLLAAWYAFRDARAHCRAVEWLADNSLITDVAAARFLDEHPEPRVP